MSTVWAFLISVAEYDDKEDNLSFVHGDNVCMMNGLVDELFIPKDQIIICGNNCYVRYSDFQAMISSYASEIGATDRVIIYFSGHGGWSPFSLQFSDCKVAFSVFCDELDKLSACAKIFIIDSCYSGNGELPERTVVAPSHDLVNYARSGYAFFASSNPGHTSLRHPEKAVSLYTYCFVEALHHTAIRDGKISLTDVARFAARMVDYLAEKNGRIPQHPTFKCLIPADVLFQVGEERKHKVNIYSASHEHYDICSTSISKTLTELRFNVFAVAKNDVSDEQIAKSTIQIVQEIMLIPGISSSSRLAKVVFVYWGTSETDVIMRNWAYRSIWTEPAVRAHWYRSDEKSRIISDVWISVMPNYDMLKKFCQEHTLSDTDCIEGMHEIADPLLTSAEKVISYFEEYENGDIPECAFVQASAERFQTIMVCYQKMSNFEIPPASLKEWVDGYECLIAAADDMRLIYTSKAYLERQENDRKVCMHGVVKRYRKDLQKITDIESRLKQADVL